MNTGHDLQNKNIIKPNYSVNKSESTQNTEQFSKQ